MVVNEFEFELLRDGTIKEESCPLRRSNSWKLLFPEVVQDVNTVGNTLNQPSISHQEDNICQGNESHVSNQLRTNPVIVVDDVNDHSSSSSSSSESQISNLGPGSPLVDSPSTMVSPPIQVMEKDEGYDPQRIPLSVFARNDSLIPAEWSTASNESLFSLHLGNASIGRDQSLLLSGELKRVGGSPPPPTIPEVEDEGEAHDVEKSKEKTVAKVESKKIVPKIVHVEKDGQPSKSSSIVSRLSDGSGESNRSFAFPVIAEGEKNAAVKGQMNQRHSGSHCETRSSVVLPTPVAPKRSSGCISCFSCSSCFPSMPCSTCRISICSCFSYTSCSSCFPSMACSSCRISICSCFSCTSCSSSCRSSFTSCFSCRSCFSCTSCFSCHTCCSCKSFRPRCC